jgi:hypothetical protein
MLEETNSPNELHESKAEALTSIDIDASGPSGYILLNDDNNSYYVLFHEIFL